MQIWSLKNKENNELNECQGRNERVITRGENEESEMEKERWGGKEETREKRSESQREKRFFDCLSVCPSVRLFCM